MTPEAMEGKFLRYVYSLTEIMLLESITNSIQFADFAQIMKMGAKQAWIAVYCLQ